MYIQHNNPGGNKEKNWLPIPESSFRLSLRLYWPDEEALNQEWYAPALNKTLRVLSDSKSNETRSFILETNKTTEIEIETNKAVISESVYSI